MSSWAFISCSGGDSMEIILQAFDIVMDILTMPIDLFGFPITLLEILAFTTAASTISWAIWTIILDR